MASTTTTTTMATAAVQEESYELAYGPNTAVDPETLQVRNVSARQEPGERTPPYLKIAAASFSFFVAGVNDGSIGPLIPYVIRDYEVSTAIVSSVYGASFAGWFLAALLNAHITQFLGLGSIMLVGAMLQVLAQVLRVLHLPFGVFAASFTAVSLGQALNDTQANTFVAGVGGKNPHRWLALIHAMYMAGCLVGPFVSTAVAAARTPSVWHLSYAAPLILGVANATLIVTAFRESVVVIRRRKAGAEQAWAEDGTTTTTTTTTPGGGRDGAGASASRGGAATALVVRTLSEPSVWLLSLFYFFYLGASITASSWVVEYLVAVRGGDVSQMGYVSAGFSGGSLLGRLLLAEPTHRFGERRMILFFSILCIAFQLVFWLVPNIVAASVAISFFGFFNGPFFATGISVGSKLFHPDIQPTALAFLFVLAQIGGSLFPVITGVIAASAGVSVLQPILVGLLAATSVSWLLVPRPKESGNTALHQE